MIDHHVLEPEANMIMSMTSLSNEENNKTSLLYVKGCFAHPPQLSAFSTSVALPVRWRSFTGFCFCDKFSY